MHSRPVSCPRGVVISRDRDKSIAGERVVSRPIKSLLFLTAMLVCLPAGAQVRKGVRVGARAAIFEAAGIDDSNQSRTIGPNARGSAVVSAQILLDRAHFSCGEIDGNFGTNLEKTVSAFQR